MSSAQFKQEVFSDRDFNVALACANCDLPVRRDEDGHRVRPALAIATEDTGFDFMQAPTLCSDCLDNAGIDSCELAAMEHGDDFPAMRYRYQLVGTPDQREVLMEYLDMVFESA